MMIVRSVISMHVRQFSSPKSGSCRTACTDHTGILAWPFNNHCNHTNWQSYGVYFV